jgi:hypothetical protein
MANVSEFSIVTYERKQGTGAQPLPGRRALELSLRAVRCVAS